MKTIHEWHRVPYTISTDKTRIDLETVLGFLATTYWAAERPPERTLRGIEHSLCFGAYHGDQQVGFARVTTDYATITYIGDVFVLESFRGQGLARWLIECIVAHPELQGIKRFLLTTHDAQGLYAQVGFMPLEVPERWMERLATSADAEKAISNDTGEG